jgi:hypothetical protein
MPLSRLRTLAVSALAAVGLAAAVGGIEVVSPGPRVPSLCPTVPASIDRTGRTEVTDELQAFVDEAACVRFPKPSSTNPARYKVDRLVLDRKEGFRMLGNGATLARTAHNDHAAFFEIRESKGVTVTNLRLRGVEEDCTDATEDVATEFEAGLQIMWSEDVTVRNLTVLRHSGDGAFVGWGVGPDGGWAHGQVPPGTITPENPNGIPVVVPRSKRIQILDSTFDCVGRQGMAFGHVDGILVSGNRLNQVALTGIDLEHFAVDNLAIQDNYFGHVRQWLFIGQVPGDNWYIGRNQSAEPIYMLIRSARPKNVTIERNVGGMIAGGPYDEVGPLVPFLVATGGDIRVVGNAQQYAPYVGTVLDLAVPTVHAMPGSSLRTTSGVCTAYAANNDFRQAKVLWDPPAEFPPGCSWVDVGNRIG